MMRRWRLVSLIAVVVLAGSLSSYVFGFISHPVNNTHFQGLSGGFFDDSGLWSISAGIPGEIPTGIFVIGFSLTTPVTSSASPAVLNPYNTLSNSVTAGDFVLYLLIKNSSAIPASTTWSLSITFSGLSPVPAPLVGYFASPPTVTSSSFSVAVYLDLGQNINTPLGYFAAITKV